jgi:cyclophilin family peptidyl-prolyl cis-trans isomerase|tara:strand:+ start:13705 stop:14295 length:591 start_codon:yes stop_codon:yes gene_type:complete
MNPRLLASRITFLSALLLGAIMTPAVAAETVNVRLNTTAGTIELALDAKAAPKTTDNFVQYVKDGHYDGLVFHRVIKGFMVQGGGYDAKYAQRTTRKPIENEAKNGLKNTRGTIAMARTGDPHSASSQFFINHGDNGFLDYPGQDGWGYAVFGKVTSGMDVLDKIAEAPTGNTPPFGRDVPVTQVVITSAEVISEE